MLRLVDAGREVLRLRLHPQWRVESLGHAGKTRREEEEQPAAQGGQVVSQTFNDWTGVTPDGSILGIRDISIEEVCALDVQLPEGPTKRAMGGCQPL
ncbi:MAG TPA: hypothetical protein VHX37_06585 [Acidobacteriaceae bacterium]|nr:hypothetical protein [Acidobacteriaceae bacterium]